MNTASIAKHHTLILIQRVIHPAVCTGRAELDEADVGMGGRGDELRPIGAD